VVGDVRAETLPASGVSRLDLARGRFPAQAANRGHHRRCDVTRGTERRLRARIAELDVGSPVDCGPVVAEARDAERVAIRDLVEARGT
jgi:hypothetical protein